MQSLLQYAYIEERCNACGGTYRVTLQEVLLEHRVEQEWRSSRHCALCAVPNSSLAAGIPAELVETLDDAWAQVALAAADAHIDLKVGAES